MGKFESLTKYLPYLDTDSIGEWIFDRENDGSPEHPMQMPYISYTHMVNSFVSDVLAFTKANKDLDTFTCIAILNQNNINYRSNKAMNETDVSNLDADCVFSLFIGAIQMERFCDGVLSSFFKNGSIRKWLERLKEIDEAEG